MKKELIFYGIGIILILWIVYTLMKRIGLIRSQAAIKESEQKAAAVRALNGMEFFDPNLYKNTNYGYAHLLPNETANKLAAEIKDAWGIFNDDEEQVYNAFRQITSKIQISQVADAYSKKYSSDLLGDIVNYLNDSEQAFLYKIVNAKPLA